MKFANYIQREVVNPVDLQILDKTYNTLEQGHQAAIQATSALQTEMAKLDLNEAESAWRQQKIDEIKATLENNSYMGNAYHALDDLQRHAGDLFSNPTLLGKLQAQKDYKDYMSNLDSRSDLTEEKKEYYRDVNKYSYKETVNPETGAVTPIKWIPTDKEVSEVPLANILENARKWMIEDSGYTTEFSFLDKDGNVVTDPSKSYTGEIYMKKGNQWVRMPEDKVRRAIEASINSIPGARESLQQDYKIAKWRYNKYGNEGGADNPLIDDSGHIRTAEEFLEARINPFVRSNTYYKSHPTIDYGNALASYRTAQINKELAAGQAQAEQDRINEIKTSLTTPIAPIRIKNTFATESTQELAYVNDRILDLLEKHFPNEDLKNLSNDKIVGYVKSLPEDSEERLELYDLYTKKFINERYLNSVKEGASEKDAAAFDLYNAIDAMTVLPEDSFGYRDRYNELYNFWWDGDTENINAYFENDDELSRFIENIGGKQTMSEFGIKISNKDGKSYANLNKNNATSLEKFARAYNASIGTWKELAGLNSKDRIVKLDADGNEIRFKPKYVYKYDKNPYKEVSFDSYLTFIDGLKQQRDNVYKQTDLLIETEAISQATPGLVELAAIMKSNPTEASKYTGAYNLEDNESKRAILAGLDLTRGIARELNDKSNNFESIDSKRKKEINQLLRNATEKDITSVVIIDPETGIPSPLVTLHYTEGNEDKNISFYAVGALNNSVVEEWKRNTDFVAKNDIIRYGAAGKGFQVTDYDYFGNVEQIILEPTIGGYAIRIDGGGPKGIVSQQDALTLRTMYYDWMQTVNTYKAYNGQINADALAAMINKTAVTLSNYVDGGGTEDYYIEKLTEQLRNSL